METAISLANKYLSQDNKKRLAHLIGLIKNEVALIKVWVNDMPSEQYYMNTAQCMENMSKICSYENKNCCITFYKKLKMLEE